MTGIEPREYRRRFSEAEKILWKHGYGSINPCRMWPCRWPWIYRAMEWVLGKRPQSELNKGQRQAYCCLGVFTHEGFPPLTSKGVERSASAYRKQKRLLHRPCDDQWEKFTGQKAYKEL